jgi:hypothetical protein
MRIHALAMMALLVPAIALAADGDPARFDGAWTVTVSCPSAAGAMGFSYQFAGEAHAGTFHAERLHEGEAGWLVVDGSIGADGEARLYAKGLVGAASFAVGQRPKGTPYGYHIDAQFNGDHGVGRRVEGRACDIDFARP